jgi:hypothetical protein
MFVADSPDILDEEDIYFFLNDEEIKEIKLDSLPAWDGMAASRGQLYISTMDGKLLCFK